MILLFTILFNLNEAIYEGLYDSGHKVLSSIVELVLNAIIVLICLSWLSGTVLFDSDKEYWSVVVAFVLVRYFMFDAFYNLARGQSIFYIVSTKLYDKILQGIGMPLVIATKMIAGFLGIIFLI